MYINCTSDTSTADILFREEGLMLWNIDFRDKRPIYEQIVSGIEKEILLGLMAPDEPLPSVRSLAVELSINPNTIQKAYRQLETDGYTYSVSGRGSFVGNTGELLKIKREETLKEVTRLLKEAVSLDISKDEINKAVREALDTREGDK